MAVAGIIQMRMRTGSYGDSGGLDGGAKAGLILGGALNGVTTITAFNMQEETARNYERVSETDSALYELEIEAEADRARVFPRLTLHT